MPDEDIAGGLSVEITSDDTKLEAGLREALAMVEQWRAQANKAAVVHPTVQAQGPAASGSTQAIQAEQQAVRRQGQARQQARRQTARQELADEEQIAVQRIQIVDRIERQRRQSRESTGPSPIEVNRSEQALFRQRQREEPSQEGARRAAQLQLLSSEAQREQQAAQAAGLGVSATIVGRQRTPAQQRRFIEDEERRAAEFQRAPVRPAARPAVVAAVREEVDSVERERRRALAELETRGTGRGRGRGGIGPTLAEVRGSDEEIARREQLRIAQAEASRLSAARTARTFASGLGGFSPLGNAREQIEANAAVAASEQRVLAARRRLADPEIIRNPRAYRKANEELTVALGDQEKALGRVQGLTTGLSAARSLAAVTLAGAAFGIGLQAISTGFELANRAAQPYLDRLTGFAQKTADYTNALSDQARQTQGNAQGVVALRLAQAGFAQSTAASLQPLIAQRTQIEAGNKALQEQIDTFRIAENLRQAPANAGIGTTTGGFLGTPLFGIPSTGEQVGNFIQRLNVAGRDTTGAHPLQIARGGQGLPFTEQGAAAFARGLSAINEQLGKGGSAVRLQQALSATDPRIEATAQAFEGLSPEMQKAIRDADLYSDAIAGSSDQIGAAIAALRAINLAGTITGPAEQLAQERIRQQNAQNSIQAIRAQQEFARPAVIANIQRQAEFARGFQLPAQQALANLAQPLQPVGTGIAAANADEQERITKNLERASELQDELNDRYARGRDILVDTYKIPAPLLDRIGAIGQEIAGIQAGLANRQAQYQVAQYNFQLSIARRTLSDIVGLTGQQFGGEAVAASRLGILERENLALSRQGQLLQFNLAQRQINFQRAVAGFTAPGLTPEERAARIEQAQIEASYAQKQLDIGRQTFQNQVQIVDIQNLRQGEDLARQIGLLLEGRELTIDTAAAQQELERLAALQSQLVQEAGTYMTQAEALVAAAFGEISQLESAAGRAMQNVAAETLRAFGLFLNGMGEQWNDLTRSGPAGDVSPNEREERGTTRDADRRSEQRPTIGGQATGGVYRANMPTGAVFGEAGDEMGIFLRNPRALTGGMGGGTSVSITFTGDISVRSDDDLRELERRVEGVVVRMLGRGSSIQGLRAS